jgi:hypothetical protein
VNNEGKTVWVSTARAGNGAPPEYAVSPDGRRAAFASSRSGLEAIYVRGVGGSDANARRVGTMARAPVWLDASTLLFQNTRPGRGGLYKMDVPLAEVAELATPRLWFEKDGEAAIAPDGQSVCVAARDEHLGNTQLYLLAIDGSGARVVPQTVGARRPCFSPEGDAIFFDAPAPREEGTSSNQPSTQPTARVIWTVPLLSAPPAAQLTAVRATKTGELEILGTAFSEAGVALDVRLELGAGDLADDTDAQSAAHWKKLDTRPVPIHGGVLASWRPIDLSDHATWTLRLTVTDADGDRAQSTLPFSWPLETSGMDVVAPPLFATERERYGLGSEAPATPTASTPPAAPAVVPPVAPVRTLERAAVPVIATADIPAIAALPAPAAVTRSARSLVVAPVEAEARPVPSGHLLPAPAAALPSKATPRQTNVAIVVAPVTAAPHKAGAPAARPHASTPARRPVRLAQAQPPAAKPRPRIEARAQMQTAPEPTPAAEDSGKRPGGIPSRMKAGSSVPVTVMLRNTGSRSWSSTGDSPVRLIYRWVDAKTNIRHRWAVKWLSETVPPGKSTQMKFDLAAPTRAGDFILTYALVRLNPQVYDGKKYTPPPTKTNDHRWPGEFGAVSFRVQVTP